MFMFVVIDDKLLHVFPVTESFQENGVASQLIGYQGQLIV